MALTDRNHLEDQHFGHPSKLKQPGEDPAIVKRILNKYGYLQDLQEEAVKTEFQQAQLIGADQV